MAYGDYAGRFPQSATWAYSTNCSHCYCQPGMAKGDVEHAKCCKCPDQMAVKFLPTAPKIAVEDVRAALVRHGKRGAGWEAMK